MRETHAGIWVASADSRCAAAYTNDSAIGKQWALMIGASEQGALDFCGAQPMASHIDHLIRAATEGECAASVEDSCITLHKTTCTWLKVT